MIDSVSFSCLLAGYLQLFQGSRGTRAFIWFGQTGPDLQLRSSKHAKDASHCQGPGLHCQRRDLSGQRHQDHRAVEPSWRHLAYSCPTSGHGGRAGRICLHHGESLLDSSALHHSTSVTCSCYLSETAAGCNQAHAATLHASDTLFFMSV